MTALPRCPALRLTNLAMDPVSLTASVITFIGLLAALGKATREALNTLRILQETKKDQFHIATALSSSIEIIDRLQSLLARVTDEQLQGSKLSSHALQAHLETTRALQSSLETLRNKWSSPCQWVRVAWGVISATRAGGYDLNYRLKRFYESMNSLSLFLNTLQALVLPLYMGSRCRVWKANGNVQTCAREFERCLYWQCRNRDSATRDYKPTASRTFGYPRFDYEDDQCNSCVCRVYSYRG